MIRRHPFALAFCVVLPGAAEYVLWVATRNWDCWFDPCDVYLGVALWIPFLVLIPTVCGLTWRYGWQRLRLQLALTAPVVASAVAGGFLLPAAARADSEDLALYSVSALGLGLFWGALASIATSIVTMIARRRFGTTREAHAE